MAAPTIDQLVVTFQTNPEAMLQLLEENQNNLPAIITSREDFIKLVKVKNDLLHGLVQEHMQKKITAQLMQAKLKNLHEAHSFYCRSCRKSHLYLFHKLSKLCRSCG